MSLFNLAGKRPDDLGVRDGKLAPCPPGSSNCVCSQHANEGKDPGPQHIAPFRFEGDPGDAMSRVIAVLFQRPHCMVVSNRPDYIHAEFTSKVMGFVDDIEFQLSATDKVIHVRAASRTGMADFGVNRARVEELREAFEDAD